MSDLVERLRDGVRREASGHSALWDSIMAEAADEIERLTAECSRYREALGCIKYASHTHHAVEMAEAALRGEFPAHDKQTADDGRERCPAHGTDYDPTGCTECDQIVPTDDGQKDA